MRFNVFRMSWRNLWRHPRRTFLTALAFAIGVFLLITSLGLGDGMHEKMIDTGIRMGSGHIVIEPEGARDTIGEQLYLSKENTSAAEQVLASAGIRGEVRGSAPRLLASGLLSSAANSTGVQVIGAIPEREANIALLPEKITKGTFLEREGRTPPALIGSGLAEKLDVDIGSKVVLMTQAGSEIQSQLLRVRGIFSTGMEQVDQRLVSVRLEDLQAVVQRPGAISHLAVFLNDSLRTPALRAEIDRELTTLAEGPAPSVLSWRQAMPELDEFIIIDDAGNYLFNGVLLFMVTLGVLNTILMAVLERKREFSLLLCLGMHPWQITTMVIVESMMLTALGAGAGLAMGWGTHAYFAKYGLDLTSLMDQSFSVAGVSVDAMVYSYLYPGRIEWTLSFVAFLGFAASLYPALRAARTDPTEATRG